MSSQDLKALANMDFNFNSYKDVLEEHILLKKLQYIEHLVMNYLSKVPEINIDSDILCYLMPQAKEVLEKVYEKSIELVYESNEEEICSQTLEKIQEYLQMTISLFETLKVVLNFVIGKRKMDFLNVKSLPLGVGQMLYATFLHCKESNNIYKAYFDSLEILMLFKTAQEIHSKLLSVLEDCLVFNILCEDEIISLNNVLDNLAEIGDVLTGMNLKSMADNWKSYMNLTQKYNKELKKCINIERPLLYFTSELIKSLNNVIDLNLNDNENITHTLKISNFMLRIMIKSCDTFWERITLHMDIFWNFFADFFGTYSPALKNNRFSDNTMNLLQTLICSGLEQFLNKLIQTREFYDLQLLESLISNSDTSLGFILVSNIVLQKLTADEKYDVSTTDFSQYLDVIFMAINKCYILFMKEDKLYEELIVSVVSLTSRTSNEHFSHIEHVLLKNLLSSSIWNCLFAYDIWRMICRTCNIQYSFDTLCWLIENFDDVLKAQYTSRPQFVILSNLLAELYQILNNNYKLQFLRKYSLNTSAHIWKHVGLKDFPNSCLIQVSNFLTYTSETMEKFDLGRFTYDEFLLMVDAMNIFGTVPFEEVYFDLKKINSLLLKLWDFDATDTNLLNSKIFRLYLDNLCKLTVNLTWRLSNTQHIQVLHQIKLLLDNCVSMKPAFLFVIQAILNRPVDFSKEQQTIFEMTSELLSQLCTNENPVICICALELVQVALNNTTWKGVVHKKIVNKNAKLQRLLSTFSNKITSNNMNTFKTYMALEQTEFQHACLENVSLGPILKRKKVEMPLENPAAEKTVAKINRSNPETSHLIQRIKKDVQYLGNLSGKDDLTQQNVKDINFILKELQHYV